MAASSGYPHCTVGFAAPEGDPGLGLRGGLWASRFVPPSLSFSICPTCLVAFLLVELKDSEVMAQLNSKRISDASGMGWEVSSGIFIMRIRVFLGSSFLVRKGRIQGQDGVCVKRGRKNRYRELGSRAKPTQSLLDHRELRCPLREERTKTVCLLAGAWRDLVTVALFLLHASWIKLTGGALEGQDSRARGGKFDPWSATCRRQHLSFPGRFKTL